MRQRILVSLIVTASIGLGACAAPPNDRGYGFGDPIDTDPAPRSAAPTDPVIGSETEGTFGTGREALGTGSGTAIVSAPVPDVNNPAISDEQNFDAVSSRETIESDAERLARQRAAYEVIRPEAVPERSGPVSPNIVAYALTTTNAPGQKVYRRFATSESKTERACARYAAPDLAQEAFLAAGGPDRDRLGLDPDGDGFACGWDPRPFRAVRGG